MPKGHKHGNLRQKNKPFKGNSKAKIEEKQSGIGGVRKKIKKTEKLMTKQDRKNRIQQQRKDKEIKDKESFKVEISKSIDPMQHEALAQLVKNQPSVPKIILLAPFNSAADTEAIKQNLASLLQGEDIMANSDPQIQNSKISHEFNYKQLSTSNKISPELKTENYIFISCPRKKDVFLDYCKVADVVCMVLSCKDVEKEALVLDPHAHAKAFDQEGYDMLECLRSQGMPNIVGVLQDIDVLPQGKQNTVKKIYQRFYESEVGLDEKFVSLEKDARSYFTFLRNLQSLPPKQLGFREIRSYMMASKLEVDTARGVLEVTGFLKGTCLNSNQLVHVTGFGDFQVGRVEVLQNPFATERTKANTTALGVASIEAGSDILVAQNAEPTKMENLTQFYNNKNFAKVTENEGPEETKDGGMEEEKSLVKASGAKKPMDEMTMEEKLWDEMEGLAIEDQHSDVSYDERNDQSMANLEEEKNKLKFTVRQRTEDELEFVDEIDYNVNVQLKDRFKKYTGLKSFRTSEWNPYSALPPEFEKIIIFDDFNKTQRNAVASANSEAFAVAGFYVKIYIMDFPLAQLQAHDKEKPFIVSSLLKYERKVSLLHMNVRRHMGATEEIRSKEQLEIHMGFRVFNSRPVFSKFFMNCQKVKMERRTLPDKVYQASIYGEVTYLPSNVLMFKVHENGARELVASGELQKCDPLKVILKRIILTGYPLKIHKRKAVIRMMFFNSIDVSYFSPIELVTKHRLKGHIKESLGTHGLMKCIFNNSIKPNDTICLYLYKRVFPKWPFEQVDSSFNTVSADIKMM